MDTADPTKAGLVLLLEIEATTDRLRALFGADHPTADGELSGFRDAITDARAWLLNGGRVQWDTDEGVRSGVAIGRRDDRLLVQAPNGDTVWMPLAALWVS